MRGPSGGRDDAVLKQRARERLDARCLLHDPIQSAVARILVHAGLGGTNNTVAGELIVKGNAGTVVDTPNEVEGKVKIQ